MEACPRRAANAGRTGTAEVFALFTEQGKEAPRRDRTLSHRGGIPLQCLCKRLVQEVARQHSSRVREVMFIMDPSGTFSHRVPPPPCKTSRFPGQSVRFLLLDGFHSFSFLYFFSHDRALHTSDPNDVGDFMFRRRLFHKAVGLLVPTAERKLPREPHSTLVDRTTLPGFTSQPQAVGRGRVVTS